MRKFLWLLIPLFLGSCEDGSRYSITAKERSLIDDENCLITQRYPVLKGIADSMTAMGMNQYFKGALQLERRLKSCLEAEGQQRKVIIGDFVSHSLNDSLVSIELKMDLQENGKRMKFYYPISMKMPEVYSPSLEMLFGDSIFTKVRPKLDAWAKADTNRSYNNFAFKLGSNYAIPFCLSADSLILYPGAEGEAVAFNRLAISRKEL